MNTKLFTLLGLLAVAATSSTTSAYAAAASTDGSLTAEEVAIPLCGQDEMITVSRLMTKNDRKKQCEATLKVKEMVRATDKKMLCSLDSCTAALKQLYVTLPNCRYKDWGIRYNVERLLKYCTIDPETIGSSAGDNKDVGTGSAATGSGNGKQKNETIKWTGSSSGGADFAPIGGTPAPTAAPTAAPQATQAPPKAASAASYVSLASSATAVVAVVAAGLTAL